MFPNDDICNVQAAKGAAQRLFRKYKNLSEKPQPILGKQEVGKLMKDTYQAINMPYNPNEEDVFSFISIFDSNSDGKIQLKDFQQMAVKYLCGLGNNEKKITEVKEEKVENKPKYLQESSQKKRNLQIEANRSQESKQYQYKTIFMEKPNLKEFVQSPKAAKLQPFSQSFPATLLSPKSKASQKQSVMSTNLSSEANNNQNPKVEQLLKKGRQLFQKHLSSSKGISQNEAPKLITATYQLINKKNFIASDEDVKIWIKLCDRNKDGIVDWQDYKYFLIRIYQRNQGESPQK